jgi:hypothetical protein
MLRKPYNMDELLGMVSGGLPKVPVFAQRSWRGKTGKAKLQVIDSISNR